MLNFGFQKFQSSSSSRDNITILFHSSIIGIWRGLAGLPFEHPFDNVKTNMQAFQNTFSNTVNQIYKRQGIMGFYSGFIVNALKVASKQVYRWPLQLSLFGLYGSLFKQSISRGTLGAICGVNMAIIQVFILCPFERLKVWLMTSSKHSTIRQFFQKLRFKALFDGVIPVFCKQFVSWVTFLGATQYFKDIAYKRSNKNRFKDELNTKQIMFVSTCVAFVNTFFVMPADCIKTHFQKNLNSEQNKVEISSSHRFRITLRQIYQKYGIKGFFRGWQIKIIQYNINSLFTVLMFERILKEYQQKCKQ